MWSKQEHLVVCSLTMKHTRVVSTKCTPGFACRAFSDTTLVCFIVNEHTTKCSHYISMLELNLIHISKRAPAGHRNMESLSKLYLNSMAMGDVTIILTLNVWEPSYLSLTRSISWLLMPWLLMSPGHQQPWYWLCRIGRFLSYLRKDLNYLRHTNVEKWHKM